MVIFTWFSFSFLQLVAYCGTVLIQLILLLSHTKCTNWTSCIKSCTKCGIVDRLAQVNQPCVIVVFMLKFTAQDSLIHDLSRGLGTRHAPLCTNLGSTVQSLCSLET